MKRIFLLAFVAFVAICAAQADVIDREAAAQRAADYLTGISANRHLSPVTNGARLAPSRNGSSQQPAYYVFSRGEGQGYVIASADDQTDPVLGYTDSGDFDYTNIPDNMRAWLDDCEAQIMDLRRLGSQGASARQLVPQRAAAVPTHPAIPKLLTCNWNQGSPYNDECPLDTDGRRCVTGCVATAMAQIMYHQRAKSVDKTTKAIPGYTSYGHGLNVKGISKGAPLDWDNMRDNGGSSSAEKLAVAQLMHYCGVSVEMDYTSGASGAHSYRVAEALVNYFGYGSSVKYVQRYEYSNVQWDALIYNELAHGNPVYLSGANSDAGHAFVTDGYDGKRNYHINWGWGGQSDGYYLLNKLTPGSQGIGGSSNGYNDYQDAIIGMVPANYGSKPIAFADNTVKKLCVAAWDTNEDGILSYNEAAKVTDLGDTFKDSRIKNFPELINFTKVKTLADDAFAGCTSLASISLPENLTTIGARAFQNCRSLKTLLLPETVTSVGEKAFAGCKALTSLALTAVPAIEARTFEDCIALVSFEIPASVQRVGDAAFNGCTKLRNVTLNTASPADITLGENIFGTLDLSEATLNIPAGGRHEWEEAPQWSAFGNIYETRQLGADQMIELQTNKTVYLYNVGTQAYLTKGEAWGTQAVVGSEPMRFELRRDDTMPDGQYYLYSNDTGKSQHVLFRTMADDKVGSGIKCCFVDGYLSENAYWVVESIGDNKYRFSVPAGGKGYAANTYLGIQPNHRTNARPENVSTTMGAYFDVKYSSYEENCQWQFVDYDATYGIYNAAEELQNLLALAKSKRINAEREQEVLDNLQSTKDDIVTAQRTLRRKLGYLHFDDEHVKEIIISNFDVNGDGELATAEAKLITSFENYFRGSAVRSLDCLESFTGVEYIYGNSFQECTELESVRLPKSVHTMYYYIFYGCTSLREVHLPEHLRYIGEKSFFNCTSLQTLYMHNPNPDAIELGNDIFEGVDLGAVTLYVPQGSRQAYAEAPVWRDFGTIVEMRAAQLPDFAPLTQDERVYIYNIGTRAYIAAGEAYGTQAVVASTGFIYKVKRTKSMPEGTYYLEAENNGGSKHVLFRTSTDNKVGAGIKTCFVDGTLGASAYWTVAEVGENIYTLQIPSTQSGYDAERFLGINVDHPTDAVDDGDPTYALYWDIPYADLPLNCQWAFVRVADMELEEQRMAASDELATLLSRADARGIEAAAEHAVMDNLQSTTQQMQDAITSLRVKLHYIDFEEDRMRQLCVARFDLDEDDEVSTEEAAAATSLGQTFRNATSLHSLNDLRYFTGLTAIDAEAFHGCSAVTQITVPQSVTAIGRSAFTGCNNLRYMRMLNPAAIAPQADNTELPQNVNVFVEAAALQAYQADPTWQTVCVSAYTGQPRVSARIATREYGRTNPTFVMAVMGAPVEGDAKFSCEAKSASPVGEYEIVVERGTVTTENVEFVPGVLNVTPAPLTITAKSYSRNIGEANPEFELEYTGLRNRETAATALTTQPTVTCAATAESPAGEYDIIVSDAEAPNYEITYVAGKLTVVDPVGINDTNMDSIDANAPVYTLDGRRVDARHQRSGIYIRGGKKVVIR